jgi:molybdate transport system regulatory protein
MTPRDPQDHRPSDPTLRLRILFGPEAMMGPGKADLLEHIGRTGSIAAAGRAMGMSYKRAWQLVEVMNAIFKRPLVESSRGGASGGGAVLTADGQRVLDLYRALEQRVASAGATELAALTDLLRDMDRGK